VALVAGHAGLQQRVVVGLEDELSGLKVGTLGQHGRFVVAQDAPERLVDPQFLTRRLQQGLVVRVLSPKRRRREPRRRRRKTLVTGRRSHFYAVPERDHHTATMWLYGCRAADLFYFELADLRLLPCENQYPLSQAQRASSVLALEKWIRTHEGKTPFDDARVAAQQWAAWLDSRAGTYGFAPRGTGLNCQFRRSPDYPPGFPPAWNAAQQDHVQRHFLSIWVDTLRQGTLPPAFNRATLDKVAQFLELGPLPTQDAQGQWRGGLDAEQLEGFRDAAVSPFQQLHQDRHLHRVADHFRLLETQWTNKDQFPRLLSAAILWQCHHLQQALLAVIRKHVRGCDTSRFSHEQTQTLNQHIEALCQELNQDLQAEPVPAVAPPETTTPQ